MARSLAAPVICADTLSHIAVLVPAHNEELLLPRCLRSILISAASTALTVDIIVAVDKCNDQSLKIASGMIGDRGLVVQSDFGMVGSARRLAAEAALARYSGPLSACWLANTDADSVVPPDWLTKQLAFANRGCDALAGIVDVDSFQGHHPLAKHRFRQSYRLFPDESHPHVHGANLGIRADLYRRAGGWADLPTAEDWDLWRRLIVVGARLKSNTQVKVLTSGRITGRAPRGFAAALAAHSKASL